MWPPAHPQHNTTNNHNNHKIDNNNHRNHKKTVNNSHNHHNHHKQPQYNYNGPNDACRIVWAQGEFLFISSCFLLNTKQYLQLLWTYWSYGKGSGKAAARRTGPNDTFCVVWAISLSFFLFVFFTYWLCLTQPHHHTKPPAPSLAGDEGSRRASLEPLAVCFIFIFIFFSRLY